MNFSPPSGWPAWARYVAERRADGEVGVGDTLERLLGSGGRLMKATLAALDIDCGCCGRQKRCNERFPYLRIEHGSERDHGVDVALPE